MNSNQWYIDDLKRQRDKLLSMTTGLFDDIEAKNKQIDDLDLLVEKYVFELYELQKKLNARIDKKQNFLAVRDLLQKSHDKAVKDLRRITDELENAELEESNDNKELGA